MQYVKLNNGIEMPQVGLGTFLIPKDKLEDTLIKAYDMGYRQFDTAWRYYNEADIARIFKKPSNPQLSSSASFLRLNVLSSLN